MFASAVNRGSSAPEVADRMPALARSLRASGDTGVGSPRATGLVVVRVVGIRVEIVSEVGT